MAVSQCTTPRPLQMACIELCEIVHTAQRETPTQIPIGLRTHFITARNEVGAR